MPPIFGVWYRFEEIAPTTIYVPENNRHGSKYGEDKVEEVDKVQHSH